MPGKINQNVLSRIGITLSDQIDLRSVNSESFQIRRHGGNALPGKYSGQTGILNFSPDEALDSNTTYQIFLPAGGIKDYAGNTIEKEFVSYFSTGETIDTALTTTTEYKRMHDIHNISIRVSPNPMNPQSKVRITLKNAANIIKNKSVLIKLYDTKGRQLLRTPSHVEKLIQGIILNTRHLASGIYLVKAEIGSRRLVQSMIINQ